MIGLMQTLGNSPITPVLLQGIIQSSSLANREEIVATLQQMSQPDPMAQQMAQLDMAIKQAQLQEIQAKAAKAAAEAQKAQVEAQLMPMEAEAKMIGNISRGARDSDDFEKRAKIAELALKEADIQSNEKITMMQMATKIQ
jgi:multidrug efflux pump subunit AcrA (membrane-fusion protein)